MTEEEKKAAAKKAEEEAKKKAEEEGAEDLDPEDLGDEEGGDEPNPESEGGEGEGGKDPEKEAKKKAEEEAEKKAEMEERARQAKARREREARERAEREKQIERDAYLKGKLEGKKVNRFTNEPIEDEYDLKVYELQEDIEKHGGDPIADLPKRMAGLEREAQNKAKMKKAEEAKKDEAVKNDIKDFMTKHPDVKVGELLEDSDFKTFVEGRLGTIPLDKLFSDFNSMKSKFSGTKKKGEGADEHVTPPSPTGGRKEHPTSYSKMSDADKEKELRRQGLIN